MEGFPFMKLVLGACGAVNFLDESCFTDCCTEYCCMFFVLVFVSEDELGRTYWVLCLFILPYSNSTWVVIVSRRLLSR